ncbi:SH3 domain-containing protein, partial [Bacillus thuringiensis]
PPPPPKPPMPTRGRVVKVTDDSYLHIRNNPSMQGEIIRRILQGANLQILGESGDWWKVRFSNARGTTEGWSHKNYIQAFDTGGYTGDWMGNEGKMAMLHKKELVLNREQTGDILRTAEIMKEVKQFMPQVPQLLSSFNGAKPAMAGASSSYEINLYVDKLTGDKKGGETVLKTVVGGLKKLGR